MIDNQTRKEDQDLIAVKQSQAYWILSTIGLASAPTDPPNGSLHKVAMACSVH